MSFSQLLGFLRHRILRLEESGEPHACVVCSEKACHLAREKGFDVVARISPSEFHRDIRKTWGSALKKSATNNLARKKSARQRFTRGQLGFALIFVLLLAAVIGLLPLGTFMLGARLLAALFFLSLISVKLLALLPRTRHVHGASQELDDEDLPEYSVLVPLYREVRVLPRLLRALSDLDYPCDKLDVKIIVEEHDAGMRDALRLALRGSTTRDWLEVIVVPDGNPRTKPRALNYALQFSRGQLVTIYDAEDIPEPGQLRKCAEVFAKADPGLACLQASLVPANKDKNWLIRQFEIEYATLFGRIMPALAGLGLPLALGGTSNHFRADVLRSAGGWDAFNVTEDADVGMRLARQGWATGMIDSNTFEEACVDYASWRRQRARWFKGFIQTWLVHTRHPLRAISEIGWTGLWVLTASTLGVFLSALLHPFLIAMAVVDFAVHPERTGAFEIAMHGLYWAVFILGYGISITLSAFAIRRRGIKRPWLNLMSMPLYWLLMWPPAVQALWEFAIKPHHWNKTEHGKSRLLLLMPAASAHRSGALLHQGQKQQNAEEKEGEQQEDIGNGQRQSLAPHYPRELHQRSA
jgi:glycosyltransferase XagB